MHEGDKYTRTYGEKDGKVVPVDVNTERSANSSHSALETQRTGVDKQALKVITAREEIGNIAQYHLGANNTHGKVFEVGGMKFVAGNVSQQGDQFTIAGTNHLGFGVVMQGRSISGPVIN